MNEAWYVIQSKPRKENQLYHYLINQGFATYYPTMKVKPVNPRASTIRPYLPRYMFVNVNLDEVGLSALQWMPYAVGLVAFDGYAVPVPDSVIDQLQVRLRTIEDTGGRVLAGLQAGDPVRITRGALAGYDAIFDQRLSGSERAQVLLDMLGRTVKLQLEASGLEKIMSTTPLY